MHSELSSAKPEVAKHILLHHAPSTRLDQLKRFNIVKNACLGHLATQRKCVNCHYRVNLFKLVEVDAAPLLSGCFNAVKIMVVDTPCGRINYLPIPKHAFLEHEANALTQRLTHER